MPCHTVTQKSAVRFALGASIGMELVSLQIVAPLTPTIRGCRNTGTRPRRRASNRRTRKKSRRWPRRPASTYSRGARKRKPRKVARSANIKAAPDDLPWRGFVASMWLWLTARRISPALASVGIEIPLRAPVVAPGMVGVGPQMREEVFLHLVDDAIRDFC
jgi:hypothetical protein